MTNTPGSRKVTTQLRILLLVAGASFLIASVHGQESDDSAIQLQLSSRVDTSSEDVRSIIANYEAYFRSSPEVEGDSNYWNASETDLYEDFDFSRASLFQGDMTAETLFQYFSPFVLSVEPIGEKYQIRVLYSSDTTDPKYVGSKVWCIHKLNVLNENGRWVFQNLIVELTKEWKSQSYGLIHYFYPENHSFDLNEAKQAQAFCERFIERFDSRGAEPFNYYVTSSIDDMGLLENFDYYFVGITTGKAREGMILTANGNEFYPHEFVHKLLPANDNRGYIIEEGLAEFLGTKEDPNEYAERMKSLAYDIRDNNSEINFQSVISQSVQFNGYPTAYPAGAALCELVYERKGDQGLKDLIHANTIDGPEIISSVCQILNVKERELKIAWEELVLGYLEE